MLVLVASLGLLILARPHQEVKVCMIQPLGLGDHSSHQVRRLYPNITIEAREYQDLVLYVLQHFPELRDVRVRVLYSEEGTTMACRPDFLSMLKGKRVYNILINNRPDFEGILLSDAPIDAQIGVIAHEMCHILEYESYGTAGIVYLASMYLDRDSKRLFERRTDERTIAKGFGRHLRSWAKFSMYDSPKADENYKAFKRDIYMTPSEIDISMRKYSCYTNNGVVGGAE